MGKLKPRSKLRESALSPVGFTACGVVFKKDVFLTRKRLLAVISVFFLLSITAGQTGDQSYVIKKGDTLWDLAFKFLGDPFQWPQLWHQNSFIANPNLIYPGSTLVVHGGGDQTPPGSQSAAAATPSVPSAEGTGAAETSGQNDFFSETKQALDQSAQPTSSPSSTGKNTSKISSLLYDTLFRMSMQRKTYFTDDFLERIAFLWDKKDEKGLVYPGNASLKKIEPKDFLKKYEEETYQQYGEVIIDPIATVHYRPGDTVDIFHSDGLKKFQGTTVNLVRRIAKASILSASGNKVSAVLFKAWDVVRSGDRVDTTTHFPCLQIDTIVDPGVTIKGTVFQRVEDTEHPHPYQSFILDKGSKDGVILGDLFAVISRNNPVFDRPTAIACAANVGATSSTLVTEKLFDSDSINPGDTVTIVKRIRFK
jgi:LysM repeat protein